MQESVSEFCGQFQYGSFDGMTDSYNYDNGRSDIPQVRWVQVHNRPSDAMRKEIFAFIRANWAGGESLPTSYLDASRTYCVFEGQNIDHFIQRLFFEKTSPFWAHKLAE
jgi:hypothetical protein